MQDELSKFTVGMLALKAAPPYGQVEVAEPVLRGVEIARKHNQFSDLNDMPRNGVEAPGAVDDFPRVGWVASVTTASNGMPVRLTMPLAAGPRE